MSQIPTLAQTWMAGTGVSGLLFSASHSRPDDIFIESIFHGLPLAGLHQAVEGLPLSSPEEILLTPDIESLITGVSATIDDFDRLNYMRRRSLEVCRESFRWEDRGRKLADAIRELLSVALVG